MKYLEMCSKIFYLTFLIGLVSQTIAGPVIVQDTDEAPMYRDVESEDFFNELCVNRTVSSLDNYKSVWAINERIESSPSHVAESISNEELTAEIRSILTQIINKVKNNERSKHHEESTALKDLENQLIYMILSVKKEDAEARMKLIIAESDQLVLKEHLENNQLMQTVNGNMADKVVMAIVLKNNPRFFIHITRQMRDMIRMGASYTDEQHTSIVVSFYAKINELYRSLKLRSDDRLSEIITNITKSFLKQLNELMTLIPSNKRALYSKCLVEESMMKYLRIDFYRKFSNDF